MPEAGYKTEPLHNTQVGHVKTGCCMAALWLQVYLTPLKRKHVGVSRVRQVMMRDLQTYQSIHAHETC